MSTCVQCKELICTNPVDNELYSLQNGAKLNPAFTFIFNGHPVTIDPFPYYPGFAIRFPCCDYWTRSVVVPVGATTEDVNNIIIALWEECANAHHDCLGFWGYPPTPPPVIPPDPECPSTGGFYPLITDFRNYSGGLPMFKDGDFDPITRTIFLPNIPVAGPHDLYCVSTRTNQINDVIPDPADPIWLGDLNFVGCPEDDAALIYSQTGAYRLFGLSSREYDLRVQGTLAFGPSPTQFATYDKSRHLVYIPLSHTANGKIQHFEINAGRTSPVSTFAGHNFGDLAYDPITKLVYIANYGTGLANPQYWIYNPDTVAITAGPILHASVNEQCDNIKIFGDTGIMVYNWFNGVTSGVRFVNIHTGAILNTVQAPNHPTSFVGAVWDTCVNRIYLCDTFSTWKFDPSTHDLTVANNKLNLNNNGLFFDSKAGYTYLLTGTAPPTYLKTINPNDPSWITV